MGASPELLPDVEGPPSLPVDRALDVQESAYYLNVSVWTVRRFIRDGRLPATKVGQAWRISPKNLRALLAGD
jgi:excisionase family DNA binding protein